MNIESKVRAVEKLFNVLEKDIRNLQEETGIHCVNNCIKCCTTPRIEATELEFYPLAYHLCKTGEAENILAKIDQLNDPAICPALQYLNIDGTPPGCAHYKHRGLICRLFTYNYGTDKYGIRRINACKTVKIDQPDQIEIANKILQAKPVGPKASNYYSQLQVIDFNEARRLYPIGNAIKIAIETMLTIIYFRGNKAI